MTSESQQLQNEHTANLGLGNQHCYLQQVKLIMCFLLVDLENLPPAGLQLPDPGQDDREPPTVKVRWTVLVMLEW